MKVRILLICVVAALCAGLLAGAQATSIGTGKTVGTVATVGNGPSNSSVAHGIFVAFPSLDNNCTGSPNTRWCLYTIKLFNGVAAISSAIKGAAVEAHWGGTGTTGISQNAPGGTINTSGNYPTYTFTDPDRRLDDVYTCAGTCSVHKQVGFMVESTNYADAAAGNMNVGIPAWYSAEQNVTAYSRTGNIIHVTVSASPGINFLTGLVVGPTPANGSFLGTVPPPDGITKSIQITNASPSDLNGVFPICDHTVSNTAGCTDPTSTDLYLISPISGTETGSITAGSCATAGGAATCIGNPIMDLATDYCSEGGVFVAWNTNFIDAYESFLTSFLTRYGPSTGTEQALGSTYFRVGFGYAGFENFPSSNNGPTANYSGGLPTNCRGVLNTWGYGGGAAVTALTFGNGASPTGLQTGEPGDCTTPGATGGCVFWDNTYLLSMFRFMKTTLRPLTTKYLSIGLSLTTYGSPDPTAATLMGRNAVSQGLGLGSAGLRQADLGYTGANQPIDNNANYVFNAHRSVGFNYQTTQSSDPTGILVEAGVNTSASTGPLNTLFPFAATQGGQQLEPITIDAECTESGFDGGVYGTAGTAHTVASSNGMTETGSVVTATQASGTVTADFIAGSTTVFVTGMTPSGYNGSWPVTATGPCTGCASGGGNLTSAQIQFTDTNTGLGNSTVAGTFANDYEIYANCSAAGYPALFTAIGALIN